MPEPLAPHDPHDEESAYADELDQPSVPRLGNRRWWWVSALILVPALALLTWIGVMNARDAITYHVVGYQVVDDRSVTVDVEVEKPEDWVVTCQVKALDVRFATVGAVPLTLPADGSSVVRRKVTVRTAARAVTGTVKECRRA
ncbi:DUF4307 domain-containing protein [Arsenicicoccus sp. oral taxon 190]|uniref:DUF4307 domain-containing protein n=1 Tax=Arsenicicoccus sp. oral taxon 190 TaxID=1658671 RepID=UPI00067B011A|nr:DUF4307 domain-containing protein [Arsenicicoccus sp. oral taxon 190]